MVGLIGVRLVKWYCSEAKMIEGISRGVKRC